LLRQGSAGTAVITATEALLWTDGRYFLQAEKELGAEWRLMRAGLPGTPEYPTYLKETLPAGARVGVDPQVRRS
jgi:Xaa-Pro aminopeptidase